MIEAPDLSSRNWWAELRNGRVRNGGAIGLESLEPAGVGQLSISRFLGQGAVYVNSGAKLRGGIC